MTDRTQTEQEDDRKTDAFIEQIEAAMPDTMSGTGITLVCVNLITTYLDREGAAVCLDAMTAVLAAHYTEACTCPECTGNNGPTVH